ncbi:porin [Nitrosospira sp. NpAV]|uniref:porin n=1 Tax=Nitrosospira sp. NpAV TaxID=58133 RepID=UPI0005A11F56|nr:porin [Nitrosospira sp. NpAV]KIO50431.1 hypothetical protein SQ11_01845 [Nitrosospira sp. NpAV]
MTCLPERRVQMRVAFIGSLLAAAMHLTEAHAEPTAYTASNIAANNTAAANLATSPPADASSNSVVDFFKKSGIRVGGWINGGATFNPSHIDGFNGPVTFGDQANRFQLNQFNVFLERAVVAQGSKWDFGGRFDVLFGTDAIFSQAYGVPAFDVNSGQPLARSNWDLDLCCASTRYYGIAIPQAYAEVYVPVGNGLNVKVGHFYTPIGYESVPAPNNFFYSHAYTMQYGEPFTHTGALGNYYINKNWMLMGGTTTGSATGGWDGGFDKQLGNWGGLAGITWTSDDLGSSANISGSYAQTSTRSNEPWGMYSIVLKHRITPNTNFVLQHDHGYAGGVLVNGVVQNAEWYGINTHTYYDITPELAIGVRAEWFRDRDGFRVFSPGRVAAATNNRGLSYALGSNQFGNSTSAPADYYAVTVGMNWKAARTLKMDWKAMKQFNVRPNVRYDAADGLHNVDYRPFGGHKDQVVLSLDFMLPF